jgi:hypothetical protein
MKASLCKILTHLLTLCRRTLTPITFSRAVVHQGTASALSRPWRRNVPLTSFLCALLVAFCATISIACAVGGVSGSDPATTFSIASLNGRYAFSFVGEDGVPHSPPDPCISRSTCNTSHR